MLHEASNERVREEGVTHTSDPAARLWPVEVHFSTGLRPSRETIRAVSERQALEFVAARYRFADMEKTRVLEVEAKRITTKAVAAANESIDRVLAAKPAPVAPPAPAPPPVEPPAPAPEPAPPATTVHVTPGEKDPLGRTLISDENARAAAILHATRQANWDELAIAIGCNRDALRRKAARFKPSLQAADLIPPTPKVATAGPLIGFLPSIGWVVAISSTADAMAAAGFTAVAPLQQAAGRR